MNLSPAYRAGDATVFVVFKLKTFLVDTPMGEYSKRWSHKTLDVAELYLSETKPEWMNFRWHEEEAKCYLTVVAINACFQLSI